MSKQKSGSPAERVIEAFGGVNETARIVGRCPSSVSRWKKAYGEGGTNGLVPPILQGTILREAKKRGVALTAEDLIGA